MAESFTTFPSQEGRDNFREAVCIDAFRVYDSCADKDCLEKLRVLFTDAGQHVIDQATAVRLRNVDVVTTWVNLEPVPFQKGFYSVDMTFFFEAHLEAGITPTAPSVNVSGICIFNKKVILYGSEGNVKIFGSDTTPNPLDSSHSSAKNLPRAVVQVADPVGLAAKLCDPRECCHEICCRVPESICRRYGGDFVYKPSGKSVAVTIGLFTIVQVERNVQMLIPAYDFCIPEKQCVTSSDDPCDLFNRIEFPTNEFFPPKVLDTNDGFESGNNCGCGYSKR